MSQDAIELRSFPVQDDGCVAYLVVDRTTRQGAVIDPRLDQVQAIALAARQEGVTVRYVLDTHTHADHLSGVRSLAELLEAQVLAGSEAPARFPARRLKDGETVALGQSQLTVMSSPGHTPDSLSLLIGRHLFTGDTVLVGGAGRTDFPGASAGALFDSFQRLKALPVDTIIHPGHDYTGHPDSTVAAELESNPLFREQDRNTLIQRLAGSRPAPVNVASILAYNNNQPKDGPISALELAARLKSDTKPVLLDVRSSAEFDGEHIAGARHLPLDSIETWGAQLDPQASYITVCKSGMRATTAATALARRGLTPRVLDGGMTAWRAAGLAIVEGRGGMSIDRQVFLIAGLLVLTGVSLGALVHPGFYGISFFVGCGMTFSGATGICGMAILLAKAPWNQVGSTACTATAGSTCAATASKATCASDSDPVRAGAK